MKKIVIGLLSVTLLVAPAFGMGRLPDSRAYAQATKHVPSVRVAAVQAAPVAKPASSAPAPAPSNSCDPTVLFKNLTPANFLSALRTCGASDISAVITDANAQSPIDYVALACMTPLQPLVGAINSGGLLMAFQAYRDARKSGVLTNCLAWVNTTLAPIQ